jgi:predicted ATPase/DNA-binding CsgD family transcriptional regulator
VDVAVSAREAEVLDALGDRLTNNEIAERLVVSVRTVETHVSALLRKFGVDNRRELAAIAATRRRTAETTARRLPSTRNLFVGRTDEVAVVTRLLATERLVTLVGPAGVGKTRLAIEAARQVEPDAVFVDLTPSATGRVLPTVASAVGAGSDQGRSLAAALTDRLAASSGLLVLDNCEHVVAEAAEVVTQLLDQVSELRILATSREPLAIGGERAVALAPLPVPTGDENVEDVAANPAVQLFLDRARAADAGFAGEVSSAATIASICRQLDGIPLAIELGAAQIAALTPQQIDVRLADRFRLLRAPARQNERHAAMETAIAWSYELLDPRERAVLDRLAVFRGAFTLEAAEVVAADPPVVSADVLELLVRLVRRSLVVAERTGDVRTYRLLETTREYSWQRLASAGELVARRDRHRDWIFGRMREAAEGLSCSVVPAWLDALDDELPNIEAALEWSMTTPEGAAEALPVIRSLERYWLARGVRRAHGVRWSAAAAHRATGLPVADRVESLLGAVLLMIWSDIRGARTLADEAAKLADASPDPRARGYAALAQAWVALLSGSADEAAAFAAVGERLLDDDDPIRLWAGAALSVVHACRGDYPTAAELTNAVAHDFQRSGDHHMYGAWLSFAVDFEVAAGDRTAAREHAEIAIVEARAADCASCEAQAVGSRALLLDAPEQRLAAARDAVRLAYDIAEPWGVFLELEIVVGALADGGALADAALLAGAVHGLRAEAGMPAIVPSRVAALRHGEDVARAGLGDEAFAELVRDGKRLDYASAVAHALG